MVPNVGRQHVARLTSTSVLKFLVRLGPVLCVYECSQGSDELSSLLHNFEVLQERRTLHSDFLLLRSAMNVNIKNANETDLAVACQFVL